MAKRSRLGPRCRSSLWILALEILPFLREFDPVTDAMESQPFLADVDFLPLSSSRTSALEWLQIAPEERPAEEAQPTAKAKSAPTRPSPKRPAQKRMTTDHGSTCRPGFNSCGLDPFYLKSVEALRTNQERLEGMVSETATPQWVPAFRQPFSSSMPAMPAVPQSQFLSAVGSPPFRSRASALRKTPTQSPVPQGLETKPSSFHQRKGS